MFRFKLEIAGQTQMDRGIARFADGVTDYTPIWPVIEDLFYAQEKAQFASEGAEGGEQWAELTEKYAKWKERHFPGAQILHRTGDLENSLTSPNDPNAVCIEARKQLTLGTKIHYAIYHQLGTRKMVARPEIVMPEAFKRELMTNVQAYLVQMASQCGFRTGLGPLTSSKLGGFAPRGTSPRTGSDGTVMF